MVKIDQYHGTVTVSSNYLNKIEWFLDGEHIKTKYNLDGKFVTTFNTVNLQGSNLRFKLTGDGGQIFSKVFALLPMNMI